MADPDRKGGGGLSLQTLAIASAGSLTAAMVTSRLFPPGTIYASALTPVIVAAVSEMLHRPADRVAELRRQRRTMVMEASGVATAGATQRREQQVEAERRDYRRRRILHPKVWVVTGLAAFAIAVAALTLPELIFGGAVATGKRTTIFGGGSSSTSTQTHTTTTPSTTTEPAKTVTETVPAQTPPSTDTQATTTEATTTTPSGGAPAPTSTGTGTGTSTAPSGSVPPPTP